MKYKIDKMKGHEDNDLILKQAIANELAEQNRLNRLSLVQTFVQGAASSLYTQIKGEDGKVYTVPPDENKKLDYKEELLAIDHTLADHLGLIEEDSIKEFEKKVKELREGNKEGVDSGKD